MKMPRKTLHPTFMKKHVLQLDCKFCSNSVCRRGMKAILLADTNVELYSTDLPPTQSVDLVNTAYCTEKCRCKIRDIACLGCGNVVGYTVILPCRKCLESCNNGHFWMFHSGVVDAIERVDTSGVQILVWGNLIEEEDGSLREDKDSLCEEMDYEEYCR